ncbi:hypothetical protein BS47DRAFT_1375149 [Hydnum rufescens UP504]|uniref:Mitochondrial import inner membrane translocase subunit TIM16 n=1 Tax=Hydnum rufescens UP504 TaxID=1448309 RepID=A0A9P6B7K3_9AGAM|nr:hypothetical protein BS47DRAFT_1375149 [Hydnum rufescens UP504]
MSVVDIVDKQSRQCAKNLSGPRIVVQILILGGQIFGKALLEAGRQAVKNAKYRPATSGSITDTLTRDHRMTLDEAYLILNLKRGDPMEKALEHYEHLYKANAPPVIDPPPPKNSPPMHSHYLLSKVVRAKERMEAEVKLTSEEEARHTGSNASSPSSSSAPSGRP